MLYLDTNVILRYLLQDHHEFSQKSISIIENNNVYVKNEVLAEVVYVLNKTYKVEKQKLRKILTDFIEVNNIHFESKEIVILALNIFENQNIDFVDALLCSYEKLKNFEIVSFDKKLNKCLNNNFNSSL